MRAKATQIVLGAVVLVTLAGCASTAGGSMTPTPTPGRPSFQTMPPMNPSGTPLTPSAEQLEAITADLAGRGITAAFQVTKAISTTWSDGSLGCPKPGMVYTQALIPGAQIVVSVDGKSYDYHFGSSATPLLCEQAK